MAERNSGDGSLLGWGGGQSPLVNVKDECVLEPGSEEQPVLLAAGSEGKLFVLAPEFLRAKEKGLFEPATAKGVVELGPGGTGCPTATNGSAVTVSENGVQVPEAEALLAEKEVQISTKIAQADALSAEWTIENKATKVKAVEKPNPLQFEVGGLEEMLLQHPLLKHTFSAPGEYRVTIKALTDDLATPEIQTATRTLTVDAAPAITTQPTAQIGEEGGTATFTAEASGFPEPSVQWEVSTNEGKNFTEVSKGTSRTLKLEGLSASQSGFEYRARFQNTIAGEVHKAITSAATLTVTAKSSKEEAPSVTQQPESRTVTEPEKANFTAKASGSPAPTIQWEVSTDGGSTFAPDVADSGNTTTTLTLNSTSTSESGRQFRAVFTNKLGKKASNAARLTVNERASELPAELPKESPKPPVENPGGGGVLHEQTVKPAPVPTAMVAGATFKVSPSGLTAVKVTCPAGETRCEGTVTLSTLTAVATRARSAKAKRAILTVASGSFSVAGGVVQTVKLHLSASARKLLAKSHVLRVKATVLAHDPAGARHTQTQVLTLRLSKH